MHQYAALEDTVYFGFSANLTTGAGDDGATPLFDVRLGGAAAGAAPVLSGTPTLLTHANYLDGSYEVAIAATAANGFAAGSTYLVFVTLTIDSVTPGACIGSFRIAPVPADVRQWLGTAAATPTVAGVPEVDVTHLLGTTWLAPGVAGTPDVNAKSLTAGAITAAAIATDAIDADALAANAVTEIQSGLATAAALAVVDGIVDDILVDSAEIGALQTTATAIKAKTDNLPSDPADASDIATAFDIVASAIAALNNLSSAQAQTAAAAALTAYDPPTNAEMEARTIAAASYATVAGLLAGVIEGAVTLKQSLQLANAANAGKVNGAATATVNLRDLGDTKNRIVGSVDASGNRSAVVVSYD